ncbi:MAG: hypothetical protein R3C53_24830 [Pirellulaceae bacterium]
MSTRANFQKSYSLRYLAPAVICLFMAAWFAYDGLIGYPQKLIYAEEYETLADLEPVERQEKWNAIAKERGWPTDRPEEKADEIADSITGQYVYAAITLCLGAVALAYYLTTRGSWVESTADGLTTSWGQTVDFSTVKQLNKKRWAEKGIAKATYQDATGSKTFVFDDFKFEREPLGQMLRELESGLKPEQIVGGPPESAKDEVEAQSESAESEEA